jgi:hypothetical protein
MIVVSHQSSIVSHRQSLVTVFSRQSSGFDWRLETGLTTGDD